MQVIMDLRQAIKSDILSTANSLGEDMECLELLFTLIDTSVCVHVVYVCIVLSVCVCVVYVHISKCACV